MRSAVRFLLPPELEASAPPETRGLRRDHVRLLLLDRDSGAVSHHRFDELPLLLEPGDLVVVNDSRTLPASLLGRTAGDVPLEVRLAARGPAGGREGTPEGSPGEPAGAGGEVWAALPLGVPADGHDPALVPTDARPPAPPLPAGERLTFTGGLTATVLGRHEEAPPLVWVAFDAGGERLAEALHRAGRPVRYAYVPRPWPLHHYQTLFAAAPGSAEMASAGRPFTVQTVRALRDRGIGLATISLHAGLSTYGDATVDRQFVPAEPYRVPEATADAVGRCRVAGGRVVAVGTTVVRALETAAAAGTVRAGAGVSRLRIGPGHRLLAVDGLVTGLHEPEASHLDLLGAFVRPEALERAYAAAVDAGYLWHEFGDVCLVLGQRGRPDEGP
ncbi:MAG TPA: S-adenosylmethionine:tRNA ribosyltransferase-isomerase [Actinomycetes bacterium]|nr:S-adenosylmethionine:tRNA ribosyltransferase-isomerase [Actinomycetes bacterium]